MRIQTVGELIEVLNKYDKSTKVCSQIKIRWVGGTNHWYSEDLLVELKKNMLVLYPQTLHDITSKEYKTSLSGKLLD